MRTQSNVILYVIKTEDRKVQFNALSLLFLFLTKLGRITKRTLISCEMEMDWEMLKGKRPHELNGQQERGQVHPARLENKGPRLMGDSIQMRQNTTETWRHCTWNWPPQWEGLTSSVRKRKIKASQGEAKCKLIKNFPSSRQRPGGKNSPKPKPASLPSSWDPLALNCALLPLTWDSSGPRAQGSCMPQPSVAISPLVFSVLGFLPHQTSKLILILVSFCLLTRWCRVCHTEQPLCFSLTNQTTAVFNPVLWSSIGSLWEGQPVCGIRGMENSNNLQVTGSVSQVLQMVRNFLIIFQIWVWVELMSQLRFNWDSKGKEWKCQ